MAALTAVLVLSACTGTTGAPTSPAASTAASAGSSAAASSPTSSSSSGSVEFSLPAPEQEAITIALAAGTEPSQFQAALAHSLGYFEKYGLEVGVVVLQGDARAFQALAAGATDFSINAASTVLNSIVTDTPAKTLAMSGTTLTDGLWCGPAFKTADDIKGKQVAIGAFGSTAHGAALLSIDELGLTATDVVITQVGGQDARLAALQGGSVACAIVDMGLEASLTEQGMNVLVNLRTAGSQWARGGLTARADWLAENPNTTAIVVAAMLEAQNIMWTDPDLAAEKFAEFSQRPFDEAKSYIASYVEIGSRDLTWSEEGWTNPQKVLAIVNPDIASVDVTTAYDSSYLEQLKAAGLNELLGIPAN
jgi:NitT/TauT family transport system substrate-binding protein